MAKLFSNKSTPYMVHRARFNSLRKVCGTIVTYRISYIYRYNQKILEQEVDIQSQNQMHFSIAVMSSSYSTVFQLSLQLCEGFALYFCKFLLVYQFLKLQEGVYKSKFIREKLEPYQYLYILQGVVGGGAFPGN